MQCSNRAEWAPMSALHTLLVAADEVDRIRSDFRDGSMPLIKSGMRPAAPICVCQLIGHRSNRRSDLIRDVGPLRVIHVISSAHLSLPLFTPKSRPPLTPQYLVQWPITDSRLRLIGGVIAASPTGCSGPQSPARGQPFQAAQHESRPPFRFFGIIEPQIWQAAQ
jgi:hypothetical protein